MKKTAVRILAICFAAAAVLAFSGTESHAYWGLKGGMFMPNGDDLDGWDSGPTGELFFGFAVGPADLEFGFGGYGLQPEGGDGATLAAGWLTATGKMHLPVGPLSLYGGAGIGGYAGGISYDDSSLDTEAGSGVGFHAVGGAELSLGVVALLAEVKWLTVKIDFDDSGKVQMGGLFANVGVLF